MEESERHLFNSKILKGLFLSTFVACGPPLALYAWGRFSGALPTAAEWSRGGGNHGPWNDAYVGGLMSLWLMAMVALPCFTLLFTFAMGFEVKEQKLLTFGKGLAIVLLQLVLGWWVLGLVGWAVD